MLTGWSLERVVVPGLGGLAGFHDVSCLLGSANLFLIGDPYARRPWV